MITGIEIINRIIIQWRSVLVANALLAGVGMGVLSYVLFPSDGYIVQTAIGGITTALALAIYNPFKVNQQLVVHWLNEVMPQLQHSTHLLIDSSDLNLVTAIQRHRVDHLLAEHKMKMPRPSSIQSGLIIFTLLLLVSVVIQLSVKNDVNEQTNDPNYIDFSSENDNQAEAVPLKVVNQSVWINYPDYTGLRSNGTSEMNVEALEGSVISWGIQFNKTPQSFYFQLSSGKQLAFNRVDDQYNAHFTLVHDDFYTFIYAANDSTQFESALYRLKVILDKPPEIELADLERFTLLEYNDAKKINIQATLKDDFGLSSSAIIATVSKGSGEAVKFREQRIRFDQVLKMGQKAATLTKTIDLDQMNMTPGDELYFYVEAYDNKAPHKNSSRTQTYFVTIRDTTQVSFSLEGSLGVDLMPEYFRSQRQLIIDTEKLIDEKKKIKPHDFNATSNALGYDQKALRLKYGQFMGEEFETGTPATTEIEGEEEHDHANDEEQEELAAYTHDHDGDNEHHLVAEDEEEDPLEDYQHAHDDPEEATLYTTSVKGKLRAAMAEMWDAELYLRLYQPAKSLPYQYKALKLIKEIKNHARIYVQRIGFEPPPIKEDQRLTGDIDEVKTWRSRYTELSTVDYPAIVQAIEYTDRLVHEKAIVYNPLIFEKAGEEVATLAIKMPGRYFETLQLLQALRLKRVAKEKQEESLIALQGQLHQIMQEVGNKPLTPAINTRDILSEAYQKAIMKEVN